MQSVVPRPVNAAPLRLITVAIGDSKFPIIQRSVPGSAAVPSGSAPKLFRLASSNSHAIGPNEFTSKASSTENNASEVASDTPAVESSPNASMSKMLCDSGPKVREARLNTAVPVQPPTPLVQLSASVIETKAVLVIGSITTPE